MPYKTWGCSECGEQAPLSLREDGMFRERMKWLREHYAMHHPSKFRLMIARGVQTRKENRVRRLN